MNITVRAIGPVAQALGGAAQQVEMDEGARLGDLLTLLGHEHPACHRYLWRAGEQGAHFFRNGCPLPLEELLKEGDRIDILLSIAGG